MLARLAAIESAVERMADMADRRLRLIVVQTWVLALLLFVALGLLIFLWCYLDVELYSIYKALI